MIYFYWFSVAEPSHKIGMGLSPASNHSKYGRIMAKLRNCFPEDIA